MSELRTFMAGVPPGLALALWNGWQPTPWQVFTAVGVYLLVWALLELGAWWEREAAREERSA